MDLFTPRTLTERNGVVQMPKSSSPDSRSRILLAGLILVTCSVTCLGGCGNRFSSIEQVLATDAKKESLLAVRLERFNRYVYWGGLQSAAEFVAPEHRRDFFKQFSDRREEEKIVDLDIDSIDYVNDGNMAEVVLATRYFSQKSNHYVRTRKERQIWQFHRLTDGWIYYGAEPMANAEGDVDANGLQQRGRAMLERSKQRQ